MVRYRTFQLRLRTSVEVAGDRRRGATCSRGVFPSLRCHGDSATALVVPSDDARNLPLVHRPARSGLLLLHLRPAPAGDVRVAQRNLRL